MKGKIIRWIDERGFGFIHSPEYVGDIFVHVSEFRQGFRSPQVGDDVAFQIAFKDGKPNAKRVALVGVEPLREKESYLWLTFVFLLVVGVGSYFLYQQFFAPKSYENMGFQCQGKRYCSQMNSCDEAKFYLEQCPGVQIDGDRDGIPCERQWCSN